MSEYVTKKRIVPFIDTSAEGATSPVWTPVKKATAFSISLNPQTQTFDFISEDTTQTEVTYYQPSIDQEVTMFKGEPDYDAFFNLVYNLPTGTAAHRDLLIAFYQEKGTESGGSTEYYKAWKSDATIQVSTLDSVAGTIGVNFGLNDKENGAITISGTPDDDGRFSPVWVSGTWEGDTFTPDTSTASDSSSSSSGYGE